MSLKVTPLIDQPMAFMVTSSEGKNQPHLVHLLGMEGNGYCTCMDFQSRCMKNIRKQKEKHDGKFKRIDYWLVETSEQVFPGSKKHLVLAKPNPLRTRCKHHQPCAKRVMDQTFKTISENEET